MYLAKYGKMYSLFRLKRFWQDLEVDKEMKIEEGDEKWSRGRRLGGYFC